MTDKPSTAPTIAFDGLHEGRHPGRHCCAAEPFPQARKPALQAGHRFRAWNRPEEILGADHRQPHPESLVGRQVLAVVNFPPRQIGPFMSEVLTLGLPDADGEVMLIGPDRKVPDGGRMY